LKSESNLRDLDVYQLLKTGYTYVRMEDLPEDRKMVPVPINLISTTHAIPELNIAPGVNPNFLLQKDDVIEYAVINGFLINLKTKESRFKNALILKD